MEKDALLLIFSNFTPKKLGVKLVLNLELGVRQHKIFTPKHEFKMNLSHNEK
jgi:hypothetical protein